MNDLTAIRREIDRLDDILINTLVARLQASEQVARYKEAYGLPVLNRERELEILEKVAAQSGNLSPYCTRLYETIFAVSRDFQKDLMTEGF